MVIGDNKRRRERVRDTTREEIKALAREHMAAEGAAALSLRAIARQMGMTAPALYRYYADRDALVSVLILEAYNDLADAVAAARDAQAADDYPSRIRAVSLEYRNWALRRPADYVLILGNPIPGYHASSELTKPAARRTLLIFVELFADAWASGQLVPPPEYRELDHAAAADVLGPGVGLGMPAPALAITLGMWGKLHGLIALELFHHLQPIIGNPDQLYRFEVDALLERMSHGAHGRNL